jgi:phage replication O-like protein O
MTGDDIQLENGNYTRIHNAILEALAKVRLAPDEYRALVFLLRKTYGFGQKEDRISLTQWQEGTGDSRPVVNAGLHHLAEMKIIYRRLEGNIFVYGFNKYLEQWAPEAFAKDSKRAANLHRNGIQLDTSIQVDTSSDIDTTNGIQLDTANGSYVDTHKRKKERKNTDVSAPTPKPKTERLPNQPYLIAEVLAEVCKMDLIANKGRLLKEAAILLKASPPATPELLRQHYNGGGWWWANDWRGQQRQFPKPATIRETWGSWGIEAPEVKPFAVEEWR